MWSLYGLFIRLLGTVIWIRSHWDDKAKAWINGRAKQQLQNHNKTILIHCASLGEYLQTKKLIEYLESTGQEVIVSFFSPSGYEKVDDKRSKYYLPLDTHDNAKEFISKINPKLAIFVKSEFWFNHIRVLSESSVPTLVINSYFSDNHYLFKSYGLWFLKQIKKLNHFYTVDRHTQSILNRKGIDECTYICLLYTSPSPRDLSTSRMPSSA